MILPLLTRRVGLRPHPLQVSNGWGVPFPLNLITWPLDIVEWVRARRTLIPRAVSQFAPSTASALSIVPSCPPRRRSSAGRSATGRASRSCRDQRQQQQQQRDGAWTTRQVAPAS